MRTYKVFLITLTLLSSLYAENIETVLKIKPPIKYYENQKYDKVFKYKEEKEEKSKYDFGLDVEINQELMTIDRFKIDIGTKFKGIN